MKPQSMLANVKTLGTSNWCSVVNIHVYNDRFVSVIKYALVVCTDQRCLMDGLQIKFVVKYSPI
jgi:hypothetical protein